MNREVHMKQVAKFLKEQLFDQLYTNNPLSFDGIVKKKFDGSIQCVDVLDLVLEKFNYQSISKYTSTSTNTIEGKVNTTQYGMFEIIGRQQTFVLKCKIKTTNEENCQQYVAIILEHK